MVASSGGEGNLPEGCLAHRLRHRPEVVCRWCGVAVRGDWLGHCRFRGPSPSFGPRPAGREGAVRPRPERAPGATGPARAPEQGRADSMSGPRTAE